MNLHSNGILSEQDLFLLRLECLANQLIQVKKESKSSTQIFENQCEAKDWLTSREAANYLGRTSGAIRNMVYRGQIYPKKFGNRLYFNRRELDRAIGTSK